MDHKTKTRTALVQRIASVLSDDLRQPKYRGDPNPLRGHCYIAAEALFHMAGGRASGLVPRRMRHEGDTHWWLLDEEGRVYDITAGQFKKPVPYDKAPRGGGFLTLEPSDRTIEVMRRVNRCAVVIGEGEHIRLVVSRLRSCR